MNAPIAFQPVASNIGLPELPKGWQWASLDHLLLRIEAGKSFKCDERPPAESEVGIVKVSAVTWGIYDENESKTVTDPTRINDAYLIRSGDFLFSRANTIELVGACVIVKDTTRKLLLSDKILRFVFAGDLKGWVNWFLKSRLGRSQIELLASGNQNSMRNIGHERIRRILIPIAPRAEMRRVESKIDELFSRIEEGERALERLQKLVERYRQSILKAAVTGELTREWREQRKGKLESGEALLKRILKARRKAWEKAELEKMKVKDIKPATGEWKEKYQEPSEPDTTDLPKLPDAWVWASLDMLADVVGGITVDQKRSGEGCEAVPYLRVANVQRGYLDLSEIKTILASRERISALQLLHGDILFNEGGDIDKLGRGWIWEDQLHVCIHQNHVFRARLFQSGAWGKVISWFANALGKELFMEMGKQTTNLASLSLSKLKTFPIPVMCGIEAAEIVSRVDDILSVIDKQVEDVAWQHAKSASLRQAVLKSAFGGRLVRQDPADEPASVLLKRIAAERSQASAPTRCGRPGRLKP